MGLLSRLTEVETEAERGSETSTASHGHKGAAPGLGPRSDFIQAQVLGQIPPGQERGGGGGGLDRQEQARPSSPWPGCDFEAELTL